jgi:hypothetical protein
MNDEIVPATVPRRRPKASQQEKSDWARRFYESGLTQREFGEQHHLALSTLQRWVAENPRLCPPVAPGSGSEALPVFTELRLAAGSGVSRWAAELCRPNGSILRLTAEVTPELLEQLWRVC